MRLLKRFRSQHWGKNHRLHYPFETCTASTGRIYEGYVDETYFSEIPADQLRNGDARFEGAWDERILRTCLWGTSHCESPVNRKPSYPRALAGSTDLVSKTRSLAHGSKLFTQ